MANNYKLSSYIYPSVNSNAIQKFEVNTQYKEDATLYYDGLLYKVLATYISDSTSIINDLLASKVKPLGIVRLTQAQRLAWTNPYDGTEVYQIDNGAGIWTYSTTTGIWTNTNNTNFLRVSRSSAQTTGLSVNSPIIYNNVEDIVGNNISLDTTNNTGIFTLQPNIKYSLKGSISGLKNNNSATCYCYYIWQESTDKSTWTNIGASGASIGVNATNYDGQLINMATATVMSSSVIYVRIAITKITGVLQIGATTDNPTDYSWAEIQELSRTSNITVNYQLPNVTEWTSYSPALTCASSTFKLATTNTMKGLYRTVGKNLSVKFVYNHNNNAGASEGTGSYPYLINIPNGFLIDTNKTGLPSVTTCYSLNGAGGDVVPLGMGELFVYTSGTSNLTSFPCKIVALSSTTLGVHMLSDYTNKSYTLWGTANSWFASGSVELTFTAEIPIL